MMTFINKSYTHTFQWLPLIDVNETQVETIGQVSLAESFSIGNISTWTQSLIFEIVTLWFR